MFLSSQLQIDGRKKDHETWAMYGFSMNSSSNIIDAEIGIASYGPVELYGGVVNNEQEENDDCKFEEDEVEGESES